MKCKTCSREMNKRSINTGFDICGKCRDVIIFNCIEEGCNKKVSKLNGRCRNHSKMKHNLSIECLKKYSESHKNEKNSMYGKCAYDIWVEKYDVEEANIKLKETNNKKSKNNIGEKNRMFGLKNELSPNYSKKRSKESKLKISKKLKNRKLSKIHKQNLSKSKLLFYKNGGKVWCKRLTAKNDNRVLNIVISFLKNMKKRNFIKN